MDYTTKRAELIAEARKIVNAAEAESRSLSAEEALRFDAAMAQADKVKEDGDRATELARAEAAQAEAAEARAQSIASQRRTEPEIRSARPQGRQTDEYRGAWTRYLRVGLAGMLPDEVRALQVGTNSEGGYLTESVLERKFVASLDSANVMRGICTVLTAGSDRLIAVESSAGSAAWTSEEAAYTESDSAFDQKSFDGHKVGTIMKVSEELLQDSVFDVGAYVAETFGRRIGVAEEAAFVSGNNSGKPNGVFTAASTGVTAASASAITSDEVIDLYHSLSSAYRSKAAWLMADATAKVLRKLKDGNSQYLWQPGLQAGEPDMLLGKPVYTSAGAPAIASGADVICFFDPSYYYIIDRGALSVQRLNELYAANGQVGFRGWHRTDGDLVLGDAARVLTMG